MAEEKKEGPRSFTRFLEQLDDGVANVELSEELHKLATKLHEEAENTNGTAKGGLVLELKLAVGARGAVSISYGVKIKEPQKKHGASHAWLTKGNNVTFENPRQQKLPLKDMNKKRIVEEPEEQEDEAVAGGGE